MDDEKRYPWELVDSSSLHSMRYIEERKVLEVRFNEKSEEPDEPKRPGIVYRYQPVEPDTYDELLGAQSIGSAFHRLIRSKFVAAPEETVES